MDSTTVLALMNEANINPMKYRIINRYANVFIYFMYLPYFFRYAKESIETTIFYEEDDVKIVKA